MIGHGTVEVRRELQMQTGVDGDHMAGLIERLRCEEHRWMEKLTAVVHRLPRTPTVRIEQDAVDSSIVENSEAVAVYSSNVAARRRRFVADAIGGTP